MYWFTKINKFTCIVTHEVTSLHIMCFKKTIKYIISNVMYYTMLYMLEWMRKGKHRIGTLRT